MAPKSTWLGGIADSQLHKLLSERAARHRSGSSTVTPTTAGEGFVFLRPICTGNDCPDPHLPPSDDPCRGQSYVWQPDLAVRLVSNEDCPTQAALKLLEQVVASNLSRFKLPDPEVRASCNNRVIDILIWGTRVTPGSCGDLARTHKYRPTSPPAATSGFTSPQGLSGGSLRTRSMLHRSGSIPTASRARTVRSTFRACRSPSSLRTSSIRLSRATTTGRGPMSVSPRLSPITCSTSAAARQ